MTGGQVQAVTVTRGEVTGCQLMMTTGPVNQVGYSFKLYVSATLAGAGQWLLREQLAVVARSLALVACCLHGLYIA